MDFEKFGISQDVLEETIVSCSKSGIDRQETITALKLIFSEFFGANASFSLEEIQHFAGKTLTETHVLAACHLVN